MTNIKTGISDSEHLGYSEHGERHMEDVLEHLHMKPRRRERVIVISDPSDIQSGDLQSVLLIGMLNDFAEKTEHGIIDFDTYASAPDKYDDWLIYDKDNLKSSAIQWSMSFTAILLTIMRTSSRMSTLKLPVSKKMTATSGSTSVSGELIS